MRVPMRKQAVSRRFGESATDYDRIARVQRHVADRLADELPQRELPRVLEVGCGTGNMTVHLLDAYPGGALAITDISPEMLELAAHRFANAKDASFAVLDGEEPGGGRRFDVIVASMVVQWFDDPVAGLERLRRLLLPNGELLYATLGPECFPEWRSALAGLGLGAGLPPIPDWPGVLAEERLVVTYASARAFLSQLKECGAGEPHAGYRPADPGSLRSAMRALEQNGSATVTWHIVYGRLDATGC